MRPTAGPDRTACVQEAEIDLAPCFNRASAEWMRVPAVSMMSSTIWTAARSTKRAGKLYGKLEPLCDAPGTYVLAKA